MLYPICASCCRYIHVNDDHLRTSGARAKNAQLCGKTRTNRVMCTGITHTHIVYSNELFRHTLARLKASGSGVGGMGVERAADTFAQRARSNTQTLCHLAAHGLHRIVSIKCVAAPMLSSNHIFPKSGGMRAYVCVVWRVHYAKQQSWLRHRDAESALRHPTTTASLVHTK